MVTLKNPKRNSQVHAFWVKVWYLYLTFILKVEFVQFTFVVDTRMGTYSNCVYFLAIHSRDLNAWLGDEREKLTVAFHYSRKWDYAKNNRKCKLVTTMIHILKTFLCALLLNLLDSVEIVSCEEMTKTKVKVVLKVDYFGRWALFLLQFFIFKIDIEIFYCVQTRLLNF